MMMMMRRRSWGIAEFEEDSVSRSMLIHLPQNILDKVGTFLFDPIFLVLSASMGLKRNSWGLRILRQSRSAMLSCRDPQVRETCCISSPVVNKYLGLGKFELKDLKINCFYRFLHDSLWKSTSSFIFEKVPVNPFCDFFQPPKYLPHSNAQSRCHCSTTHCASRRSPSWVGCEPPPVVDWKHRGSGPEVFCMMQGIQLSGLNRRKILFLLHKYTKQRLCAHLFVKYSPTSCFYKSRWPGATQIRKRPQPSTSQYEVKSNFSISAPGWTWVPGCRKGCRTL